MNEIMEFQEDLKYKPTKAEFQEITLDTPGYFSFSESHGDNCDSTETMAAFIESFKDMENIIKKNFLVIRNGHDETTKNAIERNPVQITLREEFEGVN